jgi:hypothetical protein
MVRLAELLTGDRHSAYHEAQEIPNLARRLRPVMARRIILISLPRKMTALFILGGIAGVIAWLISVFVDHFRNGVLQVFLACLVIAIGWFVYDFIDAAKNEVTGGDEAFDELLDTISELADVPAGGRQRKPVPPKAPRAGRTIQDRPQRLLVTSGNSAGTSIGLTGQQIIIGRADGATLMLNDDYVSTLHARLFPQGGQWIVEDLGSTNGTYLDRQKVTQPTPVSPGAPLRIGRTILELRG